MVGLQALRCGSDRWAAPFCSKNWRAYTERLLDVLPLPFGQLTYQKARELLPEPR